MKTTTKLSLFSDTESAHDGSTNAALGSPDPATSEILMDLARGLYKLIFQLLLLIDSDHKMAISIMNNMRHNDQMKDLSTTYLDVRGALLRCIDDADMDSLDTSTSTEGEHTPTQIAAPASVPTQDFENTLYDLIDKNKWNAALHLTRQFRKYSSTATLSPTSNFALQPSTSSTSCISSSSFNYGCMPIASDNNWMLDDTSIILLVYAQKLVKDRNGTFSSDVTNICCSSVANFYLFFFLLYLDVFISTRSEQELTEIRDILMENLYNVSSALANMEMILKNTVGNPGILKQPPSSPAITPSTSKDPSVDIITTV